MPLRTFTEAYGTPVNPGVLRHQITWERKSVTGQDSFGQDVYSWAPIVTCKAQVKGLVGRELESASQRWAEAQYQIMQHSYHGLLPSDRISWYIDGAVKTLDVLDIQDPPGSGRYQVIYAKDFIE